MNFVLDASLALAGASTHALARKHGLTSYDAAYLELAVRLGVPLATLDSPLAAAAASEGVSAYRPGDPKL